ncbi:uncharacterized protein LOC130935693 [Arachis stenosperma]|uniref:uncharacterized protein LOC130935693 n=1 Tax=Arachis stenosperma TaxID=217475 RepID=UPI0025AB87EC|nr:uncharacterized protein LOC130935693 [Arachis stenosperma]
MKNSASRLLKKIIAGLSAMAKSKTLALKSKTNAIKARLIIFSLMKNKKFLMSSISEKFHSVLGHHNKEDEANSNNFLLEDGNENEHNQNQNQNRKNKNKNAIVLFRNNAQSYEKVPNPSEAQFVEDEGGCYYNYDDGGDGDDDEKYPDLTHTLFDSEDLDLEGSVIDLVKNSKEERGQEFKLEDEIDQCAALFIKRFRRQMILQKQESLKRQQEELTNNAA